MATRPTWQTEELQEEWIDQEEGDSTSKDSAHAPTTSELSFTQTFGSVLVRSDEPGSTREAVGTFVVRDDLPVAPLAPLTPGVKNSGVKDFFSPLALEKMFQPPSPPAAIPAATPSGAPHVPAVRSRLSQVHVPNNREDTGRPHEDLEESEEWDAYADAGALGSTPCPAPPNCKFTFQVPRHGFFNPTHAAQSTPGHSYPGPSGLQAPVTDSRLRLFQFQYDTFTREHLSAIVDSIAVNSPSGGSGQMTDDSPYAHSSTRDSSLSRMRSVKRVKLSPRSDFPAQGDGAAIILRSTAGAAAPARNSNLHDANPPAPDAFRDRAGRIPALFPIPDDNLNKGPSPNGPMSSKQSSFSCLARREEADNLMEQIRKDMKGPGRILSGGTESSHGDKENVSENMHLPRDAAGRSSLRAAKKPGARKLTRTSNAARDVDMFLATSIGQMSMDPDNMLGQFPPPPIAVTTVPAASDSVAAAASRGANAGLLAPSPNAGHTNPPPTDRRKEDINRFPSSSTASGTTLTTGSNGSRQSGPRQITPNDLPDLPDRVGKMVFDKVTMRWVKDTARATAGGPTEHVPNTPASVASESEDPFRDIESLREDDRHFDTEHGQLSAEMEKSRMDVVTESEVEDEEEAELTSFSFDGASADAMEMDRRAENGDTESEEGGATAASAASEGAVSDVSGDEPPGTSGPTATQGRRRSDTMPAVTPSLSTPLPLPRPGARGAAPTPAARPVLKSNSITPMSALKNPSRERTPADMLGRRRSVSFADGKREGPIVGIGRNVPTPDGTTDGINPTADATAKGSSAIIPSVRSKRIAEALRNLEDPLSSDSSPSKASSSGRSRPEELQPLRPRRPSSAAGPSRDNSQRRISRAHTHKSPRSASRSNVSAAATPNANATFLTECSFGVAHDRLVQVITDVQPFEPHWEELTAIDLSHRNLESLARLKEFLPRLDSLTVNSNQLSWLSGVPGTVRSLAVASNALTGVTSFGHLLKLESLDISRNQVDSLRQLECLRHLRELRADGNRIASIDGLQKMDGLVKLSLQNNVIRTIELRECRWTRLEMLNLSHNKLADVGGLASLPALIALNLDNNVLSRLEAEGAMPKLRILRVSGNRLAQLNAQHWPNLRTLYADNNMLGTVAKVHRLAKLENLSLRNQGGRSGLSLSLRDVRDVKRLYISGNPLETNFLPEPCYNLVYLEAAGCRLTALPSNLARLIPNVRVLNLNYNFIADARPLAGLLRLRKLSVVGSRVQQTRQLVRVLEGMSDMEMIDFRMNPCTLGWYLPLLVKDLPGALQSRASDERERDRARSAHAPRKRARTASPPPRPSSTPSEDEENGEEEEDGGPTWKELDAKFRRDLPDAAYVGRLAYRGLVMRACPGVRVLDGVEVAQKEREKAERLLRGVARAQTHAHAQAQPLAQPQTQARAQVRAEDQTEVQAGTQAQTEVQTQAQAQAQAQGPTQKQKQRQVQGQPQAERQVQTRAESQVQPRAQTQPKARGRGEAQTQTREADQKRAQTQLQAQSQKPQRAPTLAEQQAQTQSQPQVQTQSQPQSQVQTRSQSQSPPQVQTETRAREAQAQVQSHARARGR